LYGSCGADKTCVLLPLAKEMNDRFSHPRIRTNFFLVKLGKNASDVCAVLSEAHEVGELKNSGVFE